MIDNTKHIEKLILASLRKDKKAEYDLYQLYAPKVMTVCRRYAPDESLAHDFFQECWIVVFAKLKTFDSSRGQFSGWLYRVCVNQCLIEIRKKKKQKTVDISTISEAYQEHKADYIKDEFAEINISPEDLIEAIQKLPSGYRNVFNLYVVEGWKHREIATQLNINTNTSRSQLNRAKQKIRSFLNGIIKSNYEKEVV